MGIFGWTLVDGLPILPITLADGIVHGFGDDCLANNLSVVSFNPTDKYLLGLDEERM
jgi:hypothetical protein